MEGNYTPQEVEFPPMEFLGYDFIGNTLVKKYLIPPIPNFNRRFTKFFGLNRATHSNTLSFIIVFDAFNGNLVGYYENDMGARGYLYYAFMLYDEFTRVDSILPFLQVPAELTANCTEEA